MQAQIRQRHLPVRRKLRRCEPACSGGAPCQRSDGSFSIQSDAAISANDKVSFFAQSNGQQRAGILSELLSNAGPTLGGGLLQQFSGLLHGGTISTERAKQISPDAVQQLAAHAQQQDPLVIQRAGSFYAQHPRVVPPLGAGALALIMSHLSQWL